MSKQPDWEGWTIRMASTLSRSHPLQFILAGFYKMEDIIYNSRLHEKGIARMRPEIPQIRQNSLTNIKDNAKMRFKYILRVGGGQVQNIMD